jgi:sugar phosphate permease
MIAVALVVLIFHPAAPATSSGAQDATPSEEVERARRAAQLAVVKNPMIWCFAASYFFVKPIRYALWFWLPYYFATSLGYSTVETLYSSAFDAGGFVGVIVIGMLSDRFKRLGRASMAALWLVGLALAFGAYTEWGASGKLANVALLALIGALLYGPDSILCGAAAMDAGGPRAAAMATGFVNGIGSIGPILQGLLIPPFALRYGWQAMFPLFVGMSLCAALALVPALFRARSLGGAQPSE